MNEPDKQQAGAPTPAPSEDECWREFWNVLTEALAHPPLTGCDDGNRAA